MLNQSSNCKLKPYVVCRRATTAKVSQQKLRSFTAKANVVCCNAITVKVSQQKQQSSRNHRKSFRTEAAKFRSKSNSNAITVKVSRQEPQSFAAKATVEFTYVVSQSLQKFHNGSCKVSQQNIVSYVVKQSPQKFHNSSCKVSQQKPKVVCCNAITAKVSRQKPQSFTAKATVVSQSPQKFHDRSRKVSQQKQQSSRNHRKSFTTEAAKFHSKSNSRLAITAKVSRQEPQSFAAKATVVAQSPQKFHDRSRKVSQQKQQ